MLLYIFSSSCPIGRAYSYHRGVDDVIFGPHISKQAAPPTSGRSEGDAKAELRRTGGNPPLSPISQMRVPGTKPYKVCKM